MERKIKAETYLGFAIKAGKYKAGCNSCETLKKAGVILLCETAEKNSEEVAKKLGRKFGCPIYKTAGFTLGEIAHKTGVKIIAVTDASLSKAIADCAKDDFTLI